MQVHMGSFLSGLDVTLWGLEVQGLCAGCVTGLSPLLEAAGHLAVLYMMSPSAYAMLPKGCRLPVLALDIPQPGRLHE